MEFAEHIRRAEAELPAGVAGAGRRPVRNGLGVALPASILLHLFVAALAVSAAMPGPAAVPPVIDLALVAPPGAERGTAPARARAGRPATAVTASSPPPAASPPQTRRVAPPDPVPHPIAPAAEMADPPPIRTGSGGKPPAIAVPEEARTPRPANTEPVAFPGSAAWAPFAAASPSPGPAVHAVGNPTGTGSAVEPERGYASLRDAIQKGIAYPPLARKMGWEGDVVVAFRIHPDGTASDIRVVRGSGFAVLDRNAVEAVRSASPFRTPPAEAEILTPVAYRLTR